TAACSLRIALQKWGVWIPFQQMPYIVGRALGIHQHPRRVFLLDLCQVFENSVILLLSELTDIAATPGRYKKVKVPDPGLHLPAGELCERAQFVAIVRRHSRLNDEGKVLLSQNASTPDRILPCAQDAAKSIVRFRIKGIE